MKHDLRQGTVPLLPVPRASWESEVRDLLSDHYVKHKYNREARLKEKAGYIREHLADLPAEPSGLVIDIGPGPGEFLELCRLMGHTVLGIDAAHGDGGMGDEYLRLSRLLCERQKLRVEYCGLQAVIDAPRDKLEPESVLLWNSQGSIEQAFADYLDGEPHHVHKDCRKLNWRLDDDLLRRFDMLFAVFTWSLRPGGTVLIYANGAKDTTQQYELAVEEAAARHGLKLIAYQDRLHRWQKPVASSPAPLEPTL